MQPIRQLCQRERQSHRHTTAENAESLWSTIGKAAASIFLKSCYRDFCLCFCDTSEHFRPCFL